MNTIFVLLIFIAIVVIIAASKRNRKMHESSIVNNYEADEIRAAMRNAYRKHYDRAVQEPVVDTLPHYFGLYGALASRYMAREQLKGHDIEAVLPIIVWPEVTPFMLMVEKDAIETIAEYVVYQECLSAAKVSWLKKMINDAIRTTPISEDSPREMVVAAFFQGKVGWISLLEPDVKSLLEDDSKKFVKKYASKTF